MKGWEFYRTPTLGVFPYMKGTPVYRDGMLPFLYTKLKSEGKVIETFCGEDKTMDEFIALFHRLKTLQVLAEIGVPEDPNRIVPVGFSWLDAPVGVDGARSAMPGEAFFDNASKRTSARQLAKMSLAYAFHDLKIDVMHGVQLSSNIPARNFSIRCGFREVGRIPDRIYDERTGKLEEARIMVLYAKDFLPSFWPWLEAAKAQKPMEMITVPG